MKKHFAFSLALAIMVGAATTSIWAQPPEGGQRGEGRGAGGRGGPGGGQGFGGPGGGPGGPGGMGGMMRMHPLFVALDKDADGEISADEIKNAAVALIALDKNKDGRLDESELRPDMEAMQRMRGGPGGPGGGPGGTGGGNPEEMVARMMESDKNNDGKLSKDEVPERMQPMFARADANNDGFLTKEEILAMQQNAGGGRGQRPAGGPAGGRGDRGHHVRMATNSPAQSGADP